MDFIDKRVNEILRTLGCKTIEEALDKLDKLTNKPHSQVQLNAFVNKQEGENHGRANIC